MSTDHQRFHYSVTCHTDDEAVLFCLRALCQFAEEHPKRQIGWGGTKTPEWRDRHGELTIRFTKPDFRTRFLREAERLLPGKWRLVRQSDNDPAHPQRPR